MFVVITIVLFELIIFLHEIGHFFAAKMLKIPVKEFSVGFGPLVARCDRFLTKYSFRAFPIGGYVAFEDDEKFFKNSVLKRIIVVVSGPLINLITGFFAVSLAVCLPGKYNTTTVNFVDSLNNKIKVGDRILEVNGKHIFGANDFLYNISKVPINKNIDLTVCRNNKKIELLNVGNVVNNDGCYKRLLGISLKVESLNFFSFFSQTLNNFIYQLKLIVNSVFNLFLGKVSIKEFSGPIGLTKTVNETAQKGVFALIFLFAFLSINIAVFNLIPFPILDGGQLVFLIFEAISKRRIKKSVQGVVNLVGILILVLMFVLVTFKDLINIFEF